MVLLLDRDEWFSFFHFPFQAFTGIDDIGMSIELLNSANWNLMVGKWHTFFVFP